MPVGVIEEEKEKALKNGYIILYEKFFGEKYQNRKKSKGFYSPVIKA